MATSSRPYTTPSMTFCLFSFDNVTIKNMYPKNGSMASPYYYTIKMVLLSSPTIDPWHWHTQSTIFITSTLTRYSQHTKKKKTSLNPTPHSRRFPPNEKHCMSKTSHHRCLRRCKITNKDKYLTYIDSKFIFGSIDHPRLLAVMEDLGYPLDAIALVGNIHS